MPPARNDPLDSACEASRDRTAPAAPMLLLGPFAVESSVVSTVAYHPHAALLDVGLKDGTHYRYFNVPMLTCAAFFVADSKGQFFNTHIKDRFRFQRV